MDFYGLLWTFMDLDFYGLLWTFMDLYFCGFYGLFWTFCAIHGVGLWSLVTLRNLPTAGRLLVGGIWSMDQLFLHIIFNKL